jgi:predicted TIM-barrel fold metal-dependent hydrolase
MLIVDAHAHIYADDDHVYAPVPRPTRPTEGAGTVAHLRRECKAAGVRHVVAVQATTYYGWDNRFLVDAARANAGWMAGVCTLDSDDPHTPDLLGQYARGHNVRGLRSYQAADGRLDHPGVARLWDAARRLGLTINVRVTRDKAAELSALLGRFPGLNVVLDHCLYLAAGPQHDAILGDVLALARHRNLYAKLSFLPTGSARPYPFDDLHDAARRIIRTYGPERCLWGSAFPCELWCPKTTYAQHLRLFTHELGLDARARDWVVGGTAERLYFEPKDRNQETNG